MPSESRVGLPTKAARGFAFVFHNSIILGTSIHHSGSTWLTAALEHKVGQLAAALRNSVPFCDRSPCARAARYNLLAAVPIGTLGALLLLDWNVGRLQKSHSAGTHDG